MFMGGARHRVVNGGLGLQVEAGLCRSPQVQAIAY